MGAKRLCGDSFSAICRGFCRLATLYCRSRHHWWTSSRVSLLPGESILHFLTSQVSPSVLRPSNMSIPAQDEFLKIFDRASLVRAEESDFLPGHRHSPGTILLFEPGMSRPHCPGGPLTLQLYPKLLNDLADPTRTERLQQIPRLSQTPRATSFLTQLYFQKRIYRKIRLQNLIPQSNYFNQIFRVHRRSTMTYDVEVHWTTW